MEEYTRCSWVNPKDPYSIQYHDIEWGIPVHSDRKLFEMLILECFQAGLSWSCILHKREAFRRAFDEFDPEIIANYPASKVEQLLQDPGIVRNRRKIAAAIVNAKMFFSPSRRNGRALTVICGTSLRERSFLKPERSAHRFPIRCPGISRNGA